MKPNNNATTPKSEENLLGITEIPLASKKKEWKNTTKTKLGIIYLITNTINGKMYVGQTRRMINRRWYEHIWWSTREDTYLCRAIRKYGSNAFRIEIIQKVQCKSEKSLISKLNKLETFFIKHYKSFSDRGRGYNLTTGGDAYVMGRKTRKLLSQINSGEKHPQFGKEKSKITKMRIHNALVGRTVSNKARNNMKDKYLVSFQDGKSQVIRGIKDFCKKYGYDRKNVYRVMVGKQPFHQNIIQVERIVKSSPV